MKTICIDIDGTISKYIEWVDANTFGDVLPHCAEAVHRLKADGWYVIIYTTRTDKAAIKNFLDNNNVPFDSINENPNQPANAIGGKPIADVYIDDRAMQFDGHWENVYERVTSFSTWEEVDNHTSGATLDYCKNFLLHDYTQSMMTHRHYDSINWDITKFSFGQILLAIGACWTIYTFDKADSNSRWLFMALVCFASWLFSILSLYAVVKNRSYFARISRHINELRDHAIKQKPMGFNNKANIWLDPTYPKVKDWWSTQFISLYFIGLLSLILTISSVLFFEKFWMTECVFYPIFAGVIDFALILSIILLVGKEKFKG